MPVFDFEMLEKGEEKNGEEGGEELTAGVRGGTGDTVGGKKVCFDFIWGGWCVFFPSKKKKGLVCVT